MFGRRTKRTLIENIREALWPSMGWQRTFRYVQHRLVRIKDTTSAIARGMAFGAAISCAPVPGTHIFTAAALSWVTRSSVLGSVVGTLVGNPWTFPIMWYAAYKLGDWMFFVLGLPVREMPEKFEFGELMHEIKTDPLGLFVPWVSGGFLLAFLTWPVFYLIFYRMVRQARLRQKQWKMHRLHRIARKLTEPPKK